MADKALAVRPRVGVPTGGRSLSKNRYEPRPTAATFERNNNALVDDEVQDAQARRLALQEAAIALSARATHVLNSQCDPETLDLRPFARELGDTLLHELASQVTARRKHNQRQHHHLHSTLILSGCDQFTPVRVC